MLKSVFSNWVLLAATVLSTFFILPFNIAYLGQEQYGTWLIIASLAGTIALLYNGLPMAVERYLAQAFARGESDEANRLISTAVVIMAGITLVAVIVATGVYVSLSHASLGNFDQSADARLALFLGLANAVAFVCWLPQHVILAAHQQFVALNAVKLVTLAARLALTVALVMNHPGPSSIAIAFLVLTLVECLVLTAIVRTKYPDLKLRLSMFSWTTVRRIAALSTWAFLIGIGWQLSFSIDALVIGSFIGEGAVTTFGVANALVIYLMNFVLGIAAVALPLASSLHARQDNDGLCNVFLKWTKITVLLTWIGCGFLGVFGGDFVALWVGPQYGVPAGEVLMVLSVSYLFFLPMRGMALPLLVAMGKAGWATWTVLAAGLFNLLLSMALVVPMGLVGVAVGTAIPNILMAVALLILVCRELGISVMRVVTDVFVRAVPGFAVVLTLMVAMRMAIQPSSYSELLFVVILSMLAYGMIWVFYVLRGDRHLDSFEIWERYAAPLLRRKRANSVEL